MVSNTRLYGAAIAAASGLYSLWSVTTADRMSAGAWLMAVVGIVVIVHSAILLTDVADRLGSASGPLMVVYALVMLLNQALLGSGMMGDGTGTDDGMGGTGMASQMGDTAPAANMGWDAGMVALALLMLASGLIMMRNGGMRRDSDAM
ncbi:MAG: hypothetical protein ABEJ68_10185 [Halobacteriaceae archaeon]